MEKNLYAVGWLLLIIFISSITIWFTYLFNKDGDKRKLMFSMAYMAGIIGYIFIATENYKDNLNIIYNNLYQWSSMPIMIAILIAVNESIYSVKNFNKIFNLFLIFFIFCFIIIFVPFDLSNLLNIARPIISFEILLVTSYIFIKKRELSALIFLLAIICFSVAGVALGQGLEYLSIFSTFIAFIFLVLEFYISSISSESKSGIDSYFSLESKLKFTEKALNETQSRYLDLFENANDLIQSVNADGNFIYVNKKWLKSLEYSQDEIENITIWDIVRKDQIPHCKEMFKKISSGDHIEQIETIFITKNGNEIYVEGNVNAHLENGKFLATRGIFRDVTSKKKSEIVIKESEEKYRELVNNSIDGIISIDSKMNITLWNSGAEKIFGYSGNEIMGKNLMHIVPKKYWNDKENAFKSFYKSGNGTVIGKTIELEGVRKDGNVFPLELSISSRKVRNDLIATAIVRDISDRKKVEKDLQKAKEDAEAANLSKSEFLANMSHEIRTPMNGIIGMTELALDIDLNEEQREYLETVKSSANTLLRILNDILDFSKIEAGRLDMEETDFDIVETIEKLSDIIAHRAHTKGLELIWDIEDDLPSVIIGDQIRLQQILINILGNAIKFTEKGEIILRVEKSNEITKTNEVELIFSIKDTGIGIPKDKQRKIFNTFEQADGSTTRKYGGTGLGLTISKQLIKMMNGKLWVKSKLGHGSTFYFTARFGIRSHTSIKQVCLPDVDLKGMPVLIIDDNETNRKILSKMLKSWKMIPIEADNGEEGISIIDNYHKNGKTLKLILLDSQMPGKSGFETAEKIKEKWNTNDIAIMMLTSAFNKGDRKRCRELGIASFFVKPVSPSTLLDSIMEVFGKSLIERTGLEKFPCEEFNISSNKKLNILVAEDNAVNQLLVEKILKKIGHNLKIVKNGKEVLELLEKESFDLILMDIQMPVIDGIEATKKIRENEETSNEHIPIIAITAHALKGDRERFLEIGMDDYISKPMNSKELFEVIERCINNFENSDNITSKEIEIESANEGIVIDVDEFLERVDNDFELVEELLELFLESYDKSLEEIKNAILENDPEKLKRAAHTIKGSAGNISAKSIYNSALRLEKNASDKNLINARIELSKLEKHLAILDKYINEKKWKLKIERIEIKRMCGVEKDILNEI